MAYFSKKEALNMFTGGKKKANELEVKENVKYTLWIPYDNKFFAVKKHFNVRIVPGCEDSKIKAINCINQDNSDNNFCPICDYIKTLWDEYNKEKNAKKKKEIVNKINRFHATYYYVNVIDVNEKGHPFRVLTLTASKFKELISMFRTEDEESKLPLIKDMVFYYKKSKKGNKVEYSLMDGIDKDITDQLNESLEELENRPLDEGGFNPLDEIYGYNTTQQKYLEVLRYEGELPKGKKSKKVKESNEDFELEEDKNTSLDEELDDDKSLDIDDDLDDDLSLDDKEDLSEEELSLDDLDDEDDLSLDDEKVKIVLTPEFIKENKTNKELLNNIFDAIEGFEKSKKYAENVKKLFAMTKKEEITVEIDKDIEFIPF